jgi:glutamate/tyrosine decarboxylase-like PLP-dependent enzyme
MTIRADEGAPSNLDENPDSGTPGLLRHAAELAIDYRAGLPRRRVGIEPGTTVDDLRARLGGPLPLDGSDPATVIDELAAGVDPGLVAISGPRYFGFVMGGSVPASLAADWLTSAWDQNACSYLGTPSAAVVEDVVADWLIELFGLPAGTTVGFVSGATMANFTAIAAARHAVLRAAGWDVEERGLQGAPHVRVVCGSDVHVSVVNALRYAGLGRGRLERMPVDDEGRMDPDALSTALRGREEPTIVCAQVGEVNTGAFDPIERIVSVVREHPNAWLHIDGAFGLWAAASQRLRHLVRGIDGADSWATDAHKWLNVPYDAGIVFVRDGAAHRAAMGVSAAYLPPAPGQEHDPFDYVPEMSRRARAFPIYAAIRSLGASGIAEIVERGCELAARMARRLANHPAMRVVNEVVLNQVLVGVGDAEVTTAVAERIQSDGVLWLGSTTFHGTPALRISVSGWSTRDADADRSVDAIVAAVEAVGAERAGP